MKLTNVVAGRVPVAIRQSRAANFRVTYPETRAPLAPAARRGLSCGWTRDAAGHLACAWFETPAEKPADARGPDSGEADVPCKHRRGFDRAGFLLAA